MGSEKYLDFFIQHIDHIANPKIHIKNNTVIHNLLNNMIPAVQFEDNVQLFESIKSMISKLINECYTIHKNNNYSNQ